MEDVRTRRGADIASDHHLVVAKMRLKLKKHWTTGQTALQRFNTAFLRHTDKLNQFRITQRQVPSLTQSTERNYYEGQLERDQRSINFNVSGGSAPQHTSS